MSTKEGGCPGKSSTQNCVVEVNSEGQLFNGCLSHPGIQLEIRTASVTIVSTVFLSYIGFDFLEC